MEVLQEDDQFVIKIPMNLVDAPSLARLLRELRLRELLARRQGTEEQAQQLADDLSRAWWAENQHRFLK